MPSKRERIASQRERFSRAASERRTNRSNEVVPVARPLIKGTASVISVDRFDSLTTDHRSLPTTGSDPNGRVSKHWPTEEAEAVPRGRISVGVAFAEATRVSNSIPSDSTSRIRISRADVVDSLLPRSDATFGRRRFKDTVAVARWMLREMDPVAALSRAQSDSRGSGRERPANCVPSDEYSYLLVVIYFAIDRPIDTCLSNLD